MSVYDLQQLPPEFLEVQNVCTELVGKIYGRMLLFSESKTEYMSEDTVERYLLDYEIITYPKIISLCLIYNETSRRFVDQLIKVFFNVKYKSLYDKELKKLMEHTLSVSYICYKIIFFDDNLKQCFYRYLIWLAAKFADLRKKWLLLLHLFEQNPSTLIRFGMKK